LTRFYLDTSAAAKLLVEEAESAHLAAWADTADVSFVATHLLETELRRFAARHGLPQTDVSAILARVNLHDLAPSVYRQAGLLPGPDLRSLDALHLAASILLDVEALVTYDVRHSEAAQSIGLQVRAPGARVPDRD
jgi:predicted nucleic acid-binding protein